MDRLHARIDNPTPLSDQELSHSSFHLGRIRSYLPPSSPRSPKTISIIPRSHRIAWINCTHGSIQPRRILPPSSLAQWIAVKHKFDNTYKIQPPLRPEAVSFVLQPREDSFSSNHLDRLDRTHGSLAPSLPPPLAHLKPSQSSFVLIESLR